MENNYVIDCTITPIISNCCKSVEHKKMGIMEFNPAKIDFYVSKEQENHYMDGRKLRKELSELNVLNVNVLDYLLKNPQIIPEEWKKCKKFNGARYICFWGTIYCSLKNNPYIRCLYYHNHEWMAGWLKVNNPYSCHFQAIILP